MVFPGARGPQDGVEIGEEDAVTAVPGDDVAGLGGRPANRHLVPSQKDADVGGGIDGPGPGLVEALKHSNEWIERERDDDV